MRRVFMVNKTARLFVYDDVFMIFEFGNAIGLAELEDIDSLTRSGLLTYLGEL